MNLLKKKKPHAWSPPAAVNSGFKAPQMPDGPAMAGLSPGEGAQADERAHLKSST